MMKQNGNTGLIRSFKRINLTDDGDTFLEPRFLFLRKTLIDYEICNVGATDHATSDSVLRDLVLAR